MTKKFINELLYLLLMGGQFIIRLFSLMALVFILGWLTNDVYSDISSNLSYFEPGVGKPGGNAVLKELPSPRDRIDEKQIHVLKDKVVIDIENPEWSSFTDTNSMDPVIDKGANAIHIVPEKPEDIVVGDIVAYKSKYADGTFIHRVTGIGFDDEGIYYILKGDNNPSTDPGKVRFDQIERVLVAIIY